MRSVLLIVLWLVVFIILVIGVVDGLLNRSVPLSCVMAVLLCAWLALTITWLRHGSPP